MSNQVFITKTASFLPNFPVGNDEMEDYLGKVGGKPSRVKNIILRQNGIKTRYYALDKSGQITHTNARMAAEAIRTLLRGMGKERVEVLTCGSSTPDQMLPSQASMVHGEAFDYPLETFSLAGVCLSGVAALKTAFMSVASGNSRNAVCSTSELVSPLMLSKFFEEEYSKLIQMEQNPILAFEKDFLRFMLSDGAAAVFLSDRPAGEKSLEIKWVDTVSYANRQPACMYMWADYTPEGRFQSWKEFSAKDIGERSVWCIKQNVKLLNEFGVPYFAESVKDALGRHHLDPESVRYVIPHISSMYFYGRLADSLKEKGVDLPTERWFTNLPTVGNIGSVSAYAALDELVRTKPLEKGDRILLLVPESGRFSYGTVLLRVC
ncbi:beta-ketoacyl-ACP synthase III [Prevotella sp. kh1p2]|uniref:beta-ketoacyl-ACP synthase III n=1 Tax=Prevotella sp. kh1p2 TaxID=1761883 RepID=UPI0008AE386F|nr:beta-ketoacyl-ACP synthase III [Prevotella sp. kh1p2]SES78977.1 3-oxoacyl-[acyl-carrier-protein] synthase-3 [Prevotella sp. kh1p2]SNU10640.1 3-oxoacyl-[acyl-carrier-protein] synthase-3 [Prevotellaceae bacterium KH2P17]